jgi:hypothetical protein
LVAAPRGSQRDPLSFWVQSLLLAFALGLAAVGFSNAHHPFHWLALFVALAGLVPWPGRPPLGEIGSYVVGIVIGVMLTHVVFFGEDRYHLVATPMLCILAAAALRARSDNATRTNPK